MPMSLQYNCLENRDEVDVRRWVRYVDSYSDRAVPAGHAFYSLLPLKGGKKYAIINQ